MPIRSGWPVESDVDRSSLDSQSDRPNRVHFLHAFEALITMIRGRGRANGVASLDAAGKVPATQIGRGVADGVATLGAGGRLPASQLPESVGVGFPIGGIMLWPSLGVPDIAGSRWLECGGGWVSYSEFPALCDRILDYFLAGAQSRASGPGQTNPRQFRLPNLGERVVRGFVTGGEESLGARGGADEVRLTEAHLPRHRHHVAGGGYSDATVALSGGNSLAAYHTHGGEATRYALRGRAGEPTAGDSSWSGSETPTPVGTLPPYLRLRFLIRAL